MKPFAFAFTLVVAGSAFAQVAKPKTPAKPVVKKPVVVKPITEIKCPVMPSHKVKIADAMKSKMYTDYKGRRYFFCCAGCPPAFKADPAKYAKMDSIPVPPAPKPVKPKPKVGG